MLNKMKKNQKGFTLIELIIVVAIIAILAAIAVPNFLHAREQAAAATLIADAQSVCSAVNYAKALGTSVSNPTGSNGDTIVGELGTSGTPAGIDASDINSLYTDPGFTIGANGMWTVTDTSLT